MQNKAKQQPNIRTRQTSLAVSLPVGCYHLHSPLPFIITPQPLANTEFTILWSVEHIYPSNTQAVSAYRQRLFYTVVLYWIFTDHIPILTTLHSFAERATKMSCKIQSLNCKISQHTMICNEMTAKQTNTNKFSYLEVKLQKSCISITSL